MARRKHRIECIQIDHAVGNTPHKAESLAPVEEVFLEKGVDSVTQLFISRERYNFTILIVEPISVAFLEKRVDSSMTLFTANEHGITSLQMINPVSTCGPDILWKTTLCDGTVHFVPDGTGNFKEHMSFFNLIDKSSRHLAARSLWASSPTIQNFGLLHRRLSKRKSRNDG